MIKSMHFIDLNKNEQVFTLWFAPLVKRCEDAEKRISFIASECKRFGIPLVKPADFDEFIRTVEDLRKARNTAPALFFEEIEGWLWKTEQFVME